MSEFEFSTLAILLLLLLALGIYSYWQIYRAQKAQHQQLETPDFTDEDESEKVRITDNEQLTTAQYNTRVSSFHQSWQGSEQSLVVPQTSVEAPSSDADNFSGRNVSFYIDDLDDKILESVKVNNISELLVEPEAVQQSNLATEAQTQAMPIAETAQVEIEAVEQATVNTSNGIQFFNVQDEAEQSTLVVFEPLMRLAAWGDSLPPHPIHSIDGTIDIVLSQPKHKADIERALYDLRLDTDLPLRLYGRRLGQEASAWELLENVVMYSGLRLTLQLANVSTLVNTSLIQDWFTLTQRLVKRLAATVYAWPDPAALASYAVYLHNLAQYLAVPLIVQLRKPSGLWPAYEVHQYMTQLGLSLDNQGQYLARAEDDKVLYSVLNDVGNPRAQDFVKDVLPTMHVHTLSFCLDLARIEQTYAPSLRLWHDVGQLAQSLQGQWCNIHGAILNTTLLMEHADVQIGAYYRQLFEMSIPAGSLMLRRLLR